MRLRPDSTMNPVNGEVAASDGGRLGAFSRGFHRLWWRFFEAPQLDPEAAISDIRDAQARAESGVSGLVAEHAEGPVVSMAQYRMEKEAREDAERAHSLGPAPVDPENLV